MSSINPVCLAVFRVAQKLHLRPFKRVIIKFDPFHSNVVSIREFLYNISSLRVRQTNPDCAVKTEVVCDRSDPAVELTLRDGKRVIIRTSHLTSLEVLQTMDKVATANDVQ